MSDPLMLGILVAILVILLAGLGLNVWLLQKIRIGLRNHVATQVRMDFQQSAARYIHHLDLLIRDYDPARPELFDHIRPDLHDFLMHAGRVAALDASLAIRRQAEEIRKLDEQVRTELAECIARGNGLSSAVSKDMTALRDRIRAFTPSSKA